MAKITCTLENFQNKEVSIAFKLDDTVDGYVNTIENWVKKNKWFAKTKRESLYPEGLTISINKLFDSLAKKADLFGNFNLKQAVEQVRKELLKDVEDLVNDTPEEDLGKSPEIPDGDLPKLKDKNEETLKQNLKDLFGGDSLIKLDFFGYFNKNIFLISVAYIGDNVDNSRIIRDNKTITEGMMNYINELYKIVYQFLKEHGVDLKETKPNMFIMKEDSKDYGHENPSAKNLLKLFIEYVRNLDNGQALIAQDFNNKYSRKDFPMLKAAYAYLSVLYFNDLLKQHYDKYFYIDKKLDDPIITNEDGTKQYKYRINRKLSLLISGFETNTVRDGLKEQGNFSTKIMEQIPLYGSIGYLSKNDVITTLLKLRYTAEHYKGLDLTLSDLKKAFIKTDFNLEEGWKEVMELIHKSISNGYTSTLMRVSQDDNKINSLDIDNLESIYLYFFNSKNGLYYISRKDTMSNGISRNYNIISSVFGGVQSTVQADYMEVVYDRKEKKYVVRMKKKNTSFNDVIALFRKINDEVIDTNEDIDGLILDHNGDVGYGKFIISFTEIGRNFGIFNDNIKNSHIEKINGIDDNTSIDSYFNKQIELLNSVGSIEKMMISKDIKDLEFVELIKFIDRNLTTDFHTDILGYQTLRVLKSIRNGNVIQDLFLLALRVASARKINILLKNKQSQDSNSKYIRDNVENNENLPNYKFFKNLNSNLFREVDGEEYLIGAMNTIDSIFDSIIKAQRIIRRIDSASVTKNLNNDNVPNVSVYFTNIIHDFYRQDTGINKRLMFSGVNADAIISTWIDTDIETRYGEVKSVDEFSSSELFYHSFINKFIIPLSNGVFISLPVTYSDKKKFLNYVVSLDKIYGKSNLYTLQNKFHIAKIMDTQGNYYKDLFTKICNDYRILFNISGTDNEVFFEANRLMKDKSESWLISEAKNKNIELFKDLHYRILSKNSCSTNEILCNYYNNIFSNIENLTDFLNGELASYINLLLENYTMIPISSLLKKAFSNANMIEKYWSRDGYMIFALRGGVPVKFNEKITKQDIISGKVKINPLLEKYFYISNVINNNIKLGLMGHELHHKIKELKSITGNGENLVELLEKVLKKQSELDTLINTTINPETGKVYDNLPEKTISKINSLQTELKLLRGSVNSKVYSCMALAHNALFKRTVAIPGTIRPYDLGKLDGILPVYNVAYINDVKAFVHDFKGNYGFSKDEDEDSHDGCAWIDPFTSIHENNSLDDSEVGDIKKPLWDIDSPDYGARRLIKYAVNTITNRIMLKSSRSSIIMQNLFKKMTDDIKWNGKINLVKDWAIVGYSFGDYIINDENNLYYKLGTEYRQIVDFGQDKDTGIYYTLERKVGVKGGVLDNEPYKVYHLFDSNSEHYRYTEIPVDWKERGLKTIDSLYLLHSAMGGIYSCSLIEGTLSYSEISCRAVAQFMNYVSYPTEDLKNRLNNSKNPIKHNNNKDVLASATQKDFILPLKSMLINCVVNDSASKNGTSNVNPAKRYYDNEKLNYVQLSTLKYGILQDSDHEADEALVTEMSLVISALDATGLYHDEVYDVYRALGEQTINALEIELEALKELSENNKNKLYDFVGKMVINNSRDRRGMLKAILDKLEETFNLTTDHKFDRTLCPFSDSTLYNKIILTVASAINKKGIKRKYSGSGMVMAPGFDIYLIWEIDGNPVLYEDLLELALEYNKAKKIVTYNGNLLLYNKDVVDAYLKYKLPDTQIYTLSPGTKLDIDSLVDIDPDNTITINYTRGLEELSVTITLDNLRKYYNFKLYTVNFVNDYLRREGIIGPEESVVINNIIKNNNVPRNLAPVRVKFTYQKGATAKTINIFDSLIYQELFNAKNSDDEESEKLWNSRIKKFLSNLENNKYTEWDEFGNEFTYSLIDKKVKKAETIMSNIYKTNFNIGANDSLYKILRMGPKYFLKREIRTIDSQVHNFDIQLITENAEDNVYISLDKEPSSEDWRLPWENSHKNLVRILEDIRGDSKVLNRVYIMDDEGRNTFEIGREIDVTDEIEFDRNKKVFIDKKTKKEVPLKKKSNPDGRSLYIDGDKIVEYFEFLTRYSIKDRNKTYTKYCIDQENLKKVLLPKEETSEEELLTEQLNEIINKLYKSDSFLAILPGSTLKKNNYYLVRDIFKYIKLQYKETDIGNYANNILENVLSFSLSIKDGSRDYIYLNLGKSRLFSDKVLEKYGIKRETASKRKSTDAIIRELEFVKRKNPEFKDEITALIEKYRKTKIQYWNENFKDNQSIKKYNSFLKSLEFISSRIPAQTLLSFMAMQCVGFTGLNTGYCIVSHFLTFLQGSDYDIDKSYMMGYSFDGNGMYLGWSDLFDFSSVDHITASERLPLPKNIKYKELVSGINVSDEVLKVLNSEENSVLRILLIANLIKKIYRNSNSEDKIINIYLGNISDENKKYILSILEKHENTELSPKTKDEILKNFISSHIQQISNALGNLDENYSPVEINSLRVPARNTEKSKLSKSLTLYNPATVNIMLNLNMTGKAVTGIAANGQKALFMWRTATLEALNKGETDMVTFNIELSGIQGRNNDEYNTVLILTLPDLNSDSKFYKEVLKKLYPKISSDNIGSQYISAATDNAKELILACINAGNKMAKCHLYLMSLGFDVEDIVKFMTSPAVSFIDKITEKNIFISLDLDINYVIEWAIDYIKNPNDTKNLERVPSLLMNSIKSELDEVRKSKNMNIFLSDLENLLKVLVGANEFSSFGKLLGINLGIPQTKEDLMKWKNSIKNVIAQAEKKLYISRKNRRFDNEKMLKYGVTNKYQTVYSKNFDVNKWLDDPEYRKLTYEYYNHIKESLNVFYFLDKIPHFKQMYRALSVLNSIDRHISIKGLLINEYSAMLRELYPYAPDTYEKKMLGVFSELFIELFIKGLDFPVKIEEDWTILDSNYREVIAKNKTLRLRKDSDIASFKYIFEKYIIPKLKNGTLLSEDKSKEMMQNSDVLEFLNGLVTTSDHGKPMYMANINLTLKDIDPNTRLKYYKYLKGLKLLEKYYYGSQRISDLFIMYNLVVNKNQYGSERLTELFEDFVTDFEGKGLESYMMKYLRFLGKEDYNETILEKVKKSTSLKDILLKLAPLVSRETIGKIKRSDPFIKTFDPLVGYTYWENTTYSNYREIPKLMSKQPQELDKEYVLRLRNQFKYGFGLEYANYINNIIDGLNSNDIEEVEYTFDDIINVQSIITYNTKCNE